MTARNAAGRTKPTAAGADGSPNDGRVGNARKETYAGRMKLTRTTPAGGTEPSLLA
ncbi:MAG: hypothetical protein QOD98_2718, partial [Nocardioidaceae bacterium]|nr:hypothetical protein [Nocardioidaceae bacterium]